MARNRPLLLYVDAPALLNLADAPVTAGEKFRPQFGSLNVLVDTHGIATGADPFNWQVAIPFSGYFEITFRAEINIRTTGNSVADAVGNQSISLYIGKNGTTEIPSAGAKLARSYRVLVPDSNLTTGSNWGFSIWNGSALANYKTKILVIPGSFTIIAYLLAGDLIYPEYSVDSNSSTGSDGIFAPRLTIRSIDLIGQKNT